MDKASLQHYFKPENYINRDLSWLEFNRRVLEEALNPELPLLDRIKFISIFNSNLDEFYMIRVSGLRQQIFANISEPTIDGLTPHQQIRQIEHVVQPMIEKIHTYWSDDIIPELESNSVSITQFDTLSKADQHALTEYFHNEIYPVLTPLAFDPGRPFPYISNLSISFAIQIKKRNGDKHFARVKIPSILPRILNVDKIVGHSESVTEDGFSARFIWIEDLIKNNLNFLFPGLNILHAHLFRITRDTDIEIQEDEADDLLEVIEENIRQRRFGRVVRLEVEKDMPDFISEILTKNLQIEKDDLHVTDGLLGLSDVMKLYSLPLHHLKEKPFHPVLPQAFEEEENIFSIIKHKDILLHHPFDSFIPVIDLIKEASEDPDVLAIKQTLYRVGPNSPIIKYLVEAAERKKQVAVLVELKARFDEENNIFWARELEKAGVHVVYGLVGLKTHSKMTLIVRKESDGVKRYVHLGTGNYNAQTAKLYTDTGLLTSNENICSDVSEVFNYLTGYSEQRQYRELFVAPINIRSKFIEMIQREIDNVNNGGQGKIIFKMNSLVDPTLIAALYEASQKGVKIDMIIRGICCLRPGVKGLSENIHVRSIVGRFLEHSRVYYFYNNGTEDIFMSSADLMQRNLDRRVETNFPLLDPDIKKRIVDDILKISLMDNVKARVLMPTGKYEKIEPQDGEVKVNLQEYLMEKAVDLNYSLPEFVQPETV